LSLPTAIKVFPPFRLDAVNQCLWRENTRIPLAPKAFAVLGHLVEQAGRLVTPEELLAAVWPDTYVQPEILRKYILEVRRALEDPPRKPQFIETLSRRGYRFIAAVRAENAASTSMAERPDASPKLVGREVAMAELELYRGRALQGHRQVVFVTGEAGIGKTSLVDAFHDRCGQGARFQTASRVAPGAAPSVARGQCVEGFGGKEAYYPVLEALGLFMRGPDGDHVVRTVAAQAPTWLIQFPFLVKPEQRDALLQEILGATRERMVREFCEAIEALTATHPLILILEDLQWVDDSTLDLISALARRRGPARFLLLATYRPVEVILSRSPLKMLKQDLLIHRLCHEVSLERLTGLEVEQYLAAEFPQSSLAPVLSGLIHRHSDGNPLFMVALLERLQQQGLIVQEAGRWTLAVSPEQLDPGVPETLQQMLEVQLQHLSVNDQRFLRAASVAGQRFSAWAAGAVVDAEAGQVEEICEHLAGRQQFIRRAGIQELADGSASAQYEFKHALYREVLFRQLPPLQRRQFHLRLAERLEALSTPADPALASELASHFEAGSDYARAVRYLILTAGNATRRYAHSDAVQLLHHALALLSHLAADTGRELEIEILERISDVLYAQGEMEQSAEIDYRVAELAAQGGFKAPQVYALTRLARALAFLAPDRSIVVCERAVEVSRTHDDPLLAARAEMLMACWHIVINGWSEADSAICSDARARIGRLSDELPAYYEILYAHVQCIQGDYEGAFETASAGIPKSVENDNLVVYFSAHSSLAHALLHLGRWGELLQVAGRAMEVAQKNGNAPWLGIFRATLAWLRFHARDYEGARRAAADLLRTHIEEPPGQVRTMAMITAAYASHAMGDVDQALEYLQSVCERPSHPRFFLDWYWRSIAQYGLVRVWLAKRDPAKASEQAQILIQAVSAAADPAARAFSLETQARVAMAQQDGPQALDFMQAAFAAIGSRPVPHVSLKLHATAGALYRLCGRPQEAEQHRACAAEIIQHLAHSFPEGEPLRESLLAAPIVRPSAEPKIDKTAAPSRPGSRG
jgi:DNA-binding winged helix-turn-helix (wHTH) protein